MKLLAGRPAGQSGAHYRPEVAAMSAEQPVFRIQLMRSLRLHRRLAIGVAAIIFVLMMAAHFAIRPSYTATSVVYVQPSPQPVVGGQRTNWSYDSRTYDAFIQQQVQAVTRPDILEAAIRATGPGVFQGPRESVQSAVDRLSKMLTVQREGKSYQVSISLAGSDRNTTARMVNAVTAAYLAAARSDEFTGSAERIAMLRDERNRIQQALNADYAEQAALSKQLGVANATPGNTDPYSAQIDTLHAELLKARADHDQAEAELNALTSGGPRSAALVAATQTILAKDPGLSTMKGAMSQRRSQLIAQMSQLKPANPVYQQDRAELNKLNQSLDEMTAKLQTQAEQQVDAQVRADLDRTGSVDAQLTSQLNALTALATTATPKMQRANELNADIQRLQQRYAAIDTRLHNVELDSSAPAAVHLSSAAQPPVTPNEGMRHKLVLLALPFALFFGLISALAANALDRHVHTPGDLQHILGFAPLGVLPEAAHVTPAVEQEYLLRLAAGIDHAAASAQAKTFVVTGVGTSETSDLAHALGTTLARIGRRTLTLDSASVLAPIESHESEASSAPEGSVVEQNLRRLSAANEVVLIDAPPLLLSAGTEYLARFADATLLVCDSGRTQRADVARAAQLLDRIQAPAVGAILTSIPPRTADPELLADLKATQDRLLAASRSPRHAEMESDTWRSLHPHSEETTLQNAPEIPLPTAHTRPSQAAAPSKIEQSEGHSLPRISPESNQPAESATAVPDPTPAAEQNMQPLLRDRARQEIHVSWIPQPASTWASPPWQQPVAASIPAPIPTPQVHSLTGILMPGADSSKVTQPCSPSAAPIDRASAFDALLSRLMEEATHQKPRLKAEDQAAHQEQALPGASAAGRQSSQPEPARMPRWEFASAPKPEKPAEAAPAADPAMSSTPQASVIHPQIIDVPHTQASVLPPEKIRLQDEPAVVAETAQRPRRRFEEYAFNWSDPGTGDLAILPPHSPGQYGRSRRRR